MNRSLSKLFIYLLFIISPFCLSATTYTTVATGFWINNHVWLNGIAPTYTTNDTIIIKNFIEFDSNIILNGQAFLRVDSSGALCGHDTIFSNSGSGVSVYGILECDVLWVPGGHINFYNPGLIIMMVQGHLSNGASLNSNASIQVGPWFTCISYGIEENDGYHFQIYPNPADDILNISSEIFFDEYLISDMEGRVLQKGIPFSNSLNISELAKGYYILTLISKGKYFQEKFIK